MKMWVAHRTCIVLLWNPGLLTLAVWGLECSAEADLPAKEGVVVSSAMGKGDGPKLEAERKEWGLPAAQLTGHKKKDRFAKPTKAQAAQKRRNRQEDESTTSSASLPNSPAWMKQNILGKYLFLHHRFPGWIWKSHTPGRFIDWRAGRLWCAPRFAFAELTADTDCGTLTCCFSLSYSGVCEHRTFWKGLLSFPSREPAHGRGKCSQGSHALPPTADVDADSTSALFCHYKDKGPSCVCLGL